MTIKLAPVSFLLAFIVAIPGQADACIESDEVTPDVIGELCKISVLLQIDYPIRLEAATIFSAKARTDRYSPEPHYLVTYDPSRLQADRWGLVAAFAHEFAHLSQFQHIGTTRKTIEYFGSVPAAELGADFIMGCIWQAIFPAAPISDFQSNYMLTASFQRSHEDFHGTPDQRINAFRYAIFGHNTLCTYDMAMHESYRNTIWPRLLDGG